MLFFTNFLSFRILLFLDFFIEVQIDWGGVVENEVVLLVIIGRVTTAHDIDVGSRVVDVHDVVYDFHV